MWERGRVVIHTNASTLDRQTVYLYHDSKQDIYNGIDPTGKCQIQIGTSLISSTRELNPIARKSMSRLVIQPHFRKVGQTHEKC